MIFDYLEYINTFIFKQESWHRKFSEQSLFRFYSKKKYVVFLSMSIMQFLTNLNLF